MRTKLILGLTAGMISAAQIGSAQTISTVTANDDVFRNVVIGYAEVMSAPSVVAPQELIDPAPIAAVPHELTLADASVFLHSSDSSTASVLAVGSVSSPKTTATEALGFATADTTTSTRVASRKYLDFGTGYAYPTLPATSQVELAAFANPGFSEAFMPTARETAQADMSRAAANHSSGATILPAVASPEPGTIGLLFVGSSALASRLMLRRKKS